MSKRPFAPAFKVYDLESAEEIPNKYWEKKMSPVYFQNPKYFLGTILNSPIFTFLSENLPKTGIILDGGCGCNYLAKIFDNGERKIIGLDFAVGNLVQGKIFYPQGVSVAGNLNQLPFRSNAFDGVISVSTSEHIEMGPRRLFAESYRILKKGGRLLLITPTYNLEDIFFHWLPWPFRTEIDGLRRIPHFTGNKYYKRVTELARERRHGFFAYWMSKRTVEGLLKKAGFRVTRTQRLDILGGLSRSRFFGGLVKNLSFNFPIASKRIPAENLSRKERFFFQEVVDQDWGSKLLFKGITPLYHYLNGFICEKIG